MSDAAERDEDEVVYDPTKKHRHDIGAPDHGPEQAEGTTRNIQVLLGLLILLSLGMVVYAAFRASTHGGDHPEPATETNASPTAP